MKEKQTENYMEISSEKNGQMKKQEQKRSKKLSYFSSVWIKNARQKMMIFYLAFSLSYPIF